MTNNQPPAKWTIIPHKSKTIRYTQEYGQRDNMIAYLPETIIEQLQSETKSLLDSREISRIQSEAIEKYEKLSINSRYLPAKAGQLNPEIKVHTMPSVIMLVEEARADGYKQGSADERKKLLAELKIMHRDWRNKNYNNPTIRFNNQLNTLFKELEQPVEEKK